MSSSAVSTQIKAFVLKQFPLARSKNITETDSLLESGIFDSLGILEIVTFVENEFQITCTDDELVPENFSSLNSIINFVQQKRQHL